MTDTTTPPEQKPGFFKRNATKFSVAGIIGLPLAVVGGSAWLVGQAPEPSKPVFGPPAPIVIVQPQPPTPDPIPDTNCPPRCIVDPTTPPGPPPKPDTSTMLILQQLDRLKVEIAGLNSRVDDLKRDRTETMKRIEQLKAEIAKGRVTIVQSGGSEKGLQQQIAALKAQIDALKRKVVIHNLGDDPSSSFRGRNAR